MAGNKGPWHDGRRAWERLRRWSQDGQRSVLGHDPGEALTALADVGLVRRLLDNAELAAVRAARRQGKSWAEIATKLGVTRQSAWERWRDLDDAGDTSAKSGVPQVGAATSGAISTPLARRSSRDLVSEMEHSAVVPNVIGMSFDEARQVLHQSRLVPIGSDPDGPSLFVLAMSGAVIIDQDPKAGARSAPGSSVTVWLGRGGGSAGVREPRRPRPDPKSARAVPEESLDQSVG